MVLDYGFTENSAGGLKQLRSERKCGAIVLKESGFSRMLRTQHHMAVAYILCHILLNAVVVQRRKQRRHTIDVGLPDPVSERRAIRIGVLSYHRLSTNRGEVRIVDDGRPETEEMVFF
uniref:Type II protein arginine methyltransferase n=1 Tax=Angiostrongylus cantonensis TaxID=6313 RepID=A0A0K0CUX2_ANGCA